MSQTWEMEYVKIFFKEEENIREMENAAEIEKEKHFTAISIGLYSLNCLANIFFGIISFRVHIIICIWQKRNLV